MRTVGDELVVCGVSPHVPKSGRDTLNETDMHPSLNTEDPSPTGTFTLGLLAGASIARRREGSALEISDSTEREAYTRPALRTRRHTLDESTEKTVEALIVASAAGTNVSTETPQPTSPLIPHGPTHQPPTSKLLKTFPSSIRNRASSLDEPHPLPFRYKLPPNQRYRIGDPEAFAALKERNIEWYATTGLLIQDHTGLRWNAGTYKYLLYWHVEGMPTPDNVHARQTWSTTEPDVVRDWQKEKWEAEFGSAVLDVEDEPPTPIVEDVELPVSPLTKASSLPPTPSRKRHLLPGSRSALRSQSRPASPSPSFTSDTGSSSPKREKKVRLHRHKRKRFVEWEVVDGEGVPVGERGRIVETKVDEVDVLSDNEGRTARNWLGAN